MNVDFKRTIQGSLGLIALASVMWLMPACGDAECLNGEQCTCDSGACEQDCMSDDQGGCQFTCNGDSCDNSCVGGGCQMTCNSPSCLLDCPGGNCQLTCNGASSCQITGCQAGCSLTCNGAETCAQSCDPVNGGCATQP